MDVKLQIYEELVAARKNCRVCPQLENPSVAANGLYDSNRLGPFTQWQGNIHAPLVVVAQDFASVEKFIEVEGWPGSEVQTNHTLVRLLAAAGFQILPPVKSQPDDHVFFTNAVLCLKRGAHSSSVPKECVKQCGRRFLKRTIELVGPKVVATLGRDALVATLAAFNLRMSACLAQLVESGTTFSLPNGSEVFPMFHPSPRVLAHTRRIEQQLADWARLADYRGHHIL